MPQPEVVINDALIRQAAALAATGATTKQVATGLNLSVYHTKKIMAMPDFKKVVREIGDEAVNNAKQVIRTKAGELANEVTRVIQERLANNDLEAVKVALKVIGFDQQEQVKGDTNIVVQLPGSVERSVESEFRTLEEEDEYANPGQ